MPDHVPPERVCVSARAGGEEVKDGEGKKGGKRKSEESGRGLGVQL